MPHAALELYGVRDPPSLWLCNARRTSHRRKQDVQQMSLRLGPWKSVEGQSIQHGLSFSLPVAAALLFTENHLSEHSWQS